LSVAQKGELTTKLRRADARDAHQSAENMIETSGLKIM
jgi:hypothetical protein